MDYFKIFLLGLLLILLIVIYLIFAIRNNLKAKSSEEKLKDLDNKLLSDGNIYKAAIYVKNIATGKSHCSFKGGVEDKKFYLSSVSKLFTHTIIFQLLDEKILQLDKTLADYLDRKEWKGILKIGGRDYSSDISIRQLLDQTSGLADYETEFKIDDKPLINALVEKDFELCFTSAIDATRTLKPKHKPSDSANAYYSNLNAFLLGRIAEKVTGKSIYQLFLSRIFLPLQLKSTSLVGITTDVVPIYYNEKMRNPVKYISSAPASSGVVSNLKDTMTFIEAFFSGNLFDKKHLSESVFKGIQFIPFKYGNGMMQVELGPLLSPFIEAPLIQGHSGSSGSFAFYCPKYKSFIVGSINQVTSKPYSYIYGYLNALKGT